MLFYLLLTGSERLGVITYTKTKKLRFREFKTYVKDQWGIPTVSCLAETFVPLRGL